MEIRAFNFKRQYLNVGRIILCALLVAGSLIISSRLVFGFTPEEKQPPEYQTRTLKFFILQNSAVMAGGSTVTVPFDLFIGEKEPQIKDAFIEITGAANGSNSITADIHAIQGSICTQAFATVRAKTFTLDPFGKSNNFRFLYTGSGTATDAALLYCLQQIIRSPGTFAFEFKADISGADVSALSARIVVTYQFTPPKSGSLPASGYLISSIIDTGVEKGAAYNSLMWRGIANNGKVRMQIATSDNISGPWNVNADFKGPSCAGGTTDIYVADQPDTPVEIMCPGIHNNKRYFRYKIILCSDDCQNPGSNNPEVTDVVVNWSP